MNAFDPYIGFIKAAAVIAILLGAFWGGHRSGAAGVQADWSAEREKNAEVARLLEAAHRAKELRWSRQLEDAQNEAKKREIKLRGDVAASRDAADGLRNDIDQLQRQLPELAAETCRQRADTLADLLKQCASDYRVLAEKADRHVNDVQTMNDAWPSQNSTEAPSNRKEIP